MEVGATMNDKILEFVTSLDTDSFDDFSTSSCVDSQIGLDDEINDYDYSWLKQVEESLPFISNIVHAKYGHGDNHVLKSYENRFIKTLLYRLKEFLTCEQHKVQQMNLGINEKYINAHFKSIVHNETVDIEMKITSSQKIDSKKGESYGLSLEERIKRALDITVALIASEFIMLLKEEDIIQEPISLTAIFEEELNYRKALELYHIIENFNRPKEDQNIDEVKKQVDERLLTVAFLNYQLLKECTQKKNSDNVYRLFLERLIEQMVNDSSMDEKNFKKMLTKKFEEEYNKKKNREKNIQNIFMKSIDNYNKQIKDALRSLKN